MRYLLATLALLFAAKADAQTFGQPQTVATKPAGMVVLGYCQLSVSTAVKLSTCSSGVPAGSVVAYIIPETAAVRYREDGTNPTTTVGVPVAVGQQLIYSGNLNVVTFVAQSGTSTLNVAFYR